MHVFYSKEIDIPHKPLLGLILTPKPPESACDSEITDWITMDT